MNRGIIDYDNKKYKREVSLYFNINDKNDFLNDIDETLKRNEIDEDVLFIALIETARDICKIQGTDFNEKIRRCVTLGSVDNYIDEKEGK